MNNFGEDLESDLKREQMYLKLKQDKLHRNRDHEKKMAARTREYEIPEAEIYLRAMSANTNQRNHFSPTSN